MEAKRSRARTVVGLAIAVGVGGSGLVSAATIGESRQPPPYKWTKFVSVDGQPEPVPIEWVSTPEGKFAHSIKIPNPVPKESGYRRGMSAKEYFDHLCKNEAGEFVFKIADNVEGILFMRPPARPTDYDLMDRYKLEAPGFERIYQSPRPTTAERGAEFVGPSSVRQYVYYEEPLAEGEGYVRASEPHTKLPQLMKVLKSSHYMSRFGVVWRGVRRPYDREHAIAGTEILVLDLQTKEVMGVLRNFGITGRTTDTRDGVWWLNAARCPQIRDIYPTNTSRQLYEFTAKVARPKR